MGALSYAIRPERVVWVGVIEALYAVIDRAIDDTSHDDA
jgi:hypothetical protein